MAIGEQPFCDGLHYCGLSRPGESMEPEDGRPFGILSPLLNLIQHVLLCPFQAAAPVSVLVPSSASTATGVQDLPFRY